MSVRQNILTEFVTRLSGISLLGGYQTDAGALVFVGQTPALSEADPEQALALVVGSDAVGYQGENVLTQLSIVVHAILRADVDEPTLASEAVIADIKKAVEIDRDLGGILTPRGLERGTTTAALRSQGSEYVAATVEYRCRFVERWGQP
jgi:hypothetical protein